LCAGGTPVHLPGYPFEGPRWLAPEVRHRAPEPEQAPETAAEESEKDAAELLAELWAEVLGHTELTETSDFFELGGDSLLITHLARKVNHEFGIRVPLRDMLVGRTLGRQTDMVRELVAAANA
jgi:phthiocerol/phenolphthiocerol synthesis type-I polyketide synthase E